MTWREKLGLGLAVGVGAAWGARAVLRYSRRIALDGRVAIITGGATGHGLFLARQAAEQGALLVLASRDAERLDAAADDLRQQGARGVLTVPTDVTRPDDCRRMADRAVEHFGRVDILINNAGMIQVGPMAAMTPDDFHTIMDVNFWGAYHGIEAVLPHFRRRGFGRIANIVSLGGKSPVPHLGPYTASKFALTGLTKALRVELARENILVTGVYPGTIRSGGHTHAWIKGNQQAEYAWFALSDTIPGAAISAESAARATWRAVLNGDPEVTVGWQAQLASLAEGLAPNWNAEALTLLNRLLPTDPGEATAATQGRDVPGTAARLLTRAVPEGARPEPRPT